jgi:hypothetical protein
MKSLALLLLVAACGGAAKGVPAPPGARDAAVRSGGGWTRIGDATWELAVDAGEPPDLPLTAFGAGQLLERIDLPAGARRATVAKLSVAYMDAGGAAWGVATDQGGQPGTPLGELPVTVAAGDLTRAGDPARLVDHALTGIWVTGSFWLIYGVRAGQPSIASRKGVDTGRLEYRESSTAPTYPVAHQPIVRVVLTDVE